MIFLIDFVLVYIVFLLNRFIKRLEWDRDSILVKLNIFNVIKLVYFY